MFIKTHEKVNVSLITKPPFVFFKGASKYYIKKWIRNFLSIRRGPDAVLDGLIRSLNLSSITFNVDPKLKDISDTVHVLSNPQALRSAIEMKSKGLIKHIIAGPNISILPRNDGCIYQDERIDLIILPSHWSKEAYTLDCPAIKEKIEIWPVGVEIPKSVEKKVKRLHLILFIKTAPPELIEFVVKNLDQRNIPYSILKYGTFKREEYIEKLKASSGMIYIQEVESQGVALQESWSYDVPTLVWNKGSYTFPNTNIEIHGPVSAPYLTERCGTFFESQKDFNIKLDFFISNLEKYDAQNYCTEYLSDYASLSIYKNILQKLKIK